MFQFGTGIDFKFLPESFQLRATLPSNKLDGANPQSGIDKQFYLAHTITE
jgi:hypothetical protein